MYNGGGFVSGVARVAASKMRCSGIKSTDVWDVRTSKMFMTELRDEEVLEEMSACFWKEMDAADSPRSGRRKAESSCLRTPRASSPPISMGTDGSIL